MAIVQEDGMSEDERGQTFNRVKEGYKRGEELNRSLVSCSMFKCAKLGDMGHTSLMFKWGALEMN